MWARRGRVRVRLEAGFIVVAVLLGALVLAPDARAVMARSFGVRFSTNTTGDIVLRGNAVTTCPAAHPSCANARNGIGNDAELINNNYEMVYVDVDSNSSTFNSSSANLSLPGGSRVLFAGLYWAGDTSQGTGGTAGTLRNRKFVGVSTPAASRYQLVTGVVDDDPNGAGPGDTAAYQAFADVTSLVAGAGSGRYTVANVQSGTGQDRWAGWALVVAYEHSALPSRNLTIFDGYGAASPESATGRALSIPVNGFQTPPAGSVRTRVGTVIWEGELGHHPESVTLNGRALTDARNPADNLPNSTISDLGVAVTGRNPAYADTLGVDIDRVAAPGFLPNSATSAVIAMETGEDVIYPGVFTFTTDLYTPTLVASKSAADLNGGTVRPGDVIEFVTAIDNNGMDASRETVLTDTVPAYTTFVPGSLRIGTTATTDAADSDPANFDSSSHVATFRLGTGASGTQGGKLGVGARETVRFQATVNAEAPHLASVINVANISYLGDQTGLVLSGTSNVTTNTVDHPQADLRITKAGTPATVVAGPDGTVTYTLSVTNDGPLTDPAVTVTDTLPSGLSVTSASATQGTCSSAGQTLTCNLGALTPGPTVTVTVQAAVGTTAANPATDQAAVQGTYDDPDPTDNGANLATGTTRPPQAVNDSASTDTNTAVPVTVLANDTDPDPGDTLRLSSVTNGAHGTAVANGDGTVTYTPAPGFTGSDAVTYIVSDGRGGTATATVTVAVRNAPPGAAPDPATTTLSTPVEIPVLANDTDPNSDSLSISGFDTGSGHGGTVARDDNGTPLDPSDDRLVYTPPAGFKGTDTFTYTVADGRGGTAVGTVTVEVPDAAPAALDDAATTPYLTPVTVAVLANDSDPNGDALTVESGTVGQPKDAGGTVRGTVEQAGQDVRYIPPAGFSGVVTFTYRATDGSASDPATVTITVDNAAPTAVDDAVATPYLTAVTFDPRGGDSDANGDPLQVIGISATTAGGSAVLNADGAVTYTPQVGFSGADTFTYTIADGRGGSAGATVRVTVANAAPTAVDDERSTPINTAVDIPVTANDTDPNPGDTLTVAAVGLPRDAGGNTQGSVAVSADGKTVTYTPPAGFQGAVAFPYTVSDGRGGTAAATARVAVVNDHPSALDDGGITDPATAITLMVLANDSDANGDPLTISGVIQAGHGTVTFDPAAGTVTYTPVATYAGIDTFSYTVGDGRGGSGTAQVTVTVLDAFPAALPDTATTARGVATSIDVIANDTDPNGDPLFLLSFQGTTDQGGTVSRVDGGTPDDRSDDAVLYTPPAGFTGTDSFTYTVTDDRGGSATGLVTVTVPDQAPVAVDDTAEVPTAGSVSVAVLANDTDPDADPLTVIAYTDPPHGSVVLQVDVRTLVYTPDPQHAGDDRFSYTAADDRGATATAAVAVTVLNAPPVAVDDQQGTGPAIPVRVDVRENDSDPNGDLLVISAFDPTTAGGGGVTLDDQGSASLFDDVLRYTPPAGFKGVDSFGYTISDGRGGTDRATVAVVVSDADPVGVDDLGAVAAGSSVDLTVLDNDTDPNGDPRSVVPGSVTDPKDNSGTPQGTAALGTGGVVTYRTLRTFVGQIRFTYQVTDGNPAGTPSTATVRVTVTDLPPVAADDTATTPRDTSVDLDVLANDSDPNDDHLTVVGVAGARPGALLTVAAGGGSLTYTPAPGFTGEDTFTYTVDDGRGQTASARVTVTVPNENPVAADDTATAGGEAGSAFLVLANDSDPRHDPLHVLGIRDGPTHGAAIPNADGSVTYSPDLGFTGVDAFTYIVSDGRGGTATARVIVTVPNTAPNAVADGGGTGPGQALTVAVLDNDSDVNPGQTLTVVSVGPPGHGTATVNSDGTVTYTPQSGFQGTDDFTYQISDGAGGIDVAAVSVVVTGAAPVAVDDLAHTPHATAVTVDVLDNDFDPNPGDVLSLVAGSLSVPVGENGEPAGAVSPGSGGTATYTPPPGYVGDVSFTYRVTDTDPATAEDEATVTVTVEDAPPVVGDDSFALEGAGPFPLAVLANDSDPNGDRLSIVGIGTSAHGAGLALAAGGGTFKASAAAPTPDLIYTPPSGFAGTDTFTYTVSDGRSGGVDASGKVSITLTLPPKVNNLPHFDTDVTNTVQTTDPGGGFTPLRASDPDGDPLVYSLVDGALPPVVTLRPDGTFVGPAIVAGTYLVRIRACDTVVPPACEDIALTLAVIEGGVGPESEPKRPPQGVVPPLPDSLPRTGGGPWLPGGLSAVGLSFLLREWARRRRRIDPGGRPPDSIGPLPLR